MSALRLDYSGCLHRMPRPSQPGPVSLVLGQRLPGGPGPRCTSGPADAQGMSESGIMTQGERTNIRGDRREMGGLVWRRGVRGRGGHRRRAGPAAAASRPALTSFSMLTRARY